jgi:hypothetical protein
MEIGKPQRIHRIEPLKQPVPVKREPAERPKPAPVPSTPRKA